MKVQFMLRPGEHGLDPSILSAEDLIGSPLVSTYDDGRKEQSGIIDEAVPCDGGFLMTATIEEPSEALIKEMGITIIEP